MPKKKLLDIPSDFVDHILAVIADESEIGRKKIVAISKRAEKKYDSPVKSWLTGWVYQYTRTRGGEVQQSIKVMEDFPDAYTRLQEFKLMISKGEWNVGSYNYFLFLELIDAIPDYEFLEEEFQHAFILRLKDLVIKQIDNFMAQYKASLEQIKIREIERQATRQTTLQSVEHVLVFNNLAAAKEAQTKQQDKTIFCLALKNKQWHLSWLDSTGDIYPLSLSGELVQRLSAFEVQNVEKLNSINFRRVKRECLKSRDCYLEKIQLNVDPKDSQTHDVLNNKQLAEQGMTSTFVLRTKGDEIGLWWINSMGIANEITLSQYSQLSSWLATHKAPVSEEDILHFKSYLLSVKTTQSFSVIKMEEMNNMLFNVLHHKTGKQKEPVGEIKKTEVVIQKLDLGVFKIVEDHFKRRVEKTAPETPKLVTKVVAEDSGAIVSKKLTMDRYDALAQLAFFGQQRKSDAEAEILKEKRPSL
jgi:hypothetical protein